jgi:hypothetical protein
LLDIRKDSVRDWPKIEDLSVNLLFLYMII